jgi:hypothetical protein
MLGALVLLLAMAAVLLAAPRAGAEDNFTVRNETGERFTPNNQDNFEEECWYDATGIFNPATGSAGVLSSITAEAHLFECNDGWGSNLGYGQTLETFEQNEREVYFWWGGVGAFAFSAYDPSIGAGTLSCQAAGSEWAEGNYFTPIERFMTAEVDGRTCTIAWLPGVGGGAARLGLASKPSRAAAGHVRFVGSLASVLGRTAKVPVQVFGLGSAHHRVTVTLRSASGERLGSGSRILKVGDRSRVIDVALSPAAAREVSTRHEFKVKAAVDIASPGGTGDTTTQLLLRRGLVGRR